jgi:hypothetical protein
MDSVKLQTYIQNAHFSLLRTLKLSRDFVAYADFLTDKNALLRGQIKMDTHEKLSWPAVEQQSQRE